MKTHELKILHKYFDDVQNHIKNFEVRYNDRDYQVGDVLVLKEWDKGKFTGREYATTITYIFTDKEEAPVNCVLNENWVILGLAVPVNNFYQNGGNGIQIGHIESMTIR